MDAHSKDLLSGFREEDDGERKVQRLDSRTEEVDLRLGLSLGGRLGAERRRRRGEGLAGSSSAALAPPAPVRANSSSQGSGFPLNGAVVEPSALLRAALSPFFIGSAAGVQPSATPQGSGFPLTSIKEEAVEGILRGTSSLPAGIEGELRKRKPENLKWLEIQRIKMQKIALKGTPSAEGRSLSSAVASWSAGTNGVMATASSSASAMIAAALGSGGGQQDASERPAAMVRKMPSVWTSGLPNGMITEGFLYEYSRIDKVGIMCVCHGSLFTPAEFVEHAGGGQVANPLRSIIVKPPSWL